MPDFTGRKVGALRNTEGNGIVVRLLDFRHLHDLVWDDLATVKGVMWSASRCYMVTRYPAVKESVVNGRISLDLVPHAPFKAQTFSDWFPAEDEYISECHGQAGKARKRWQAGKHGTEYE